MLACASRPQAASVELGFGAGHDVQTAEFDRTGLGKLGERLRELRRRRSCDDAVDGSLAEERHRFADIAGRLDLNLLAVEALHELLAALRVRFEDQHTSRGPRNEAAEPVEQSIDEIVAGDRFGQEGQGAGLQRPVSRLIRRDDANRDVPQGDVAFQPLQDSPAVDVGKMEIERDGVRLVLADECQRRCAERGHQPLHSFVASRFEQEAGKGFVVFDDQKDLVARLNVVAVVAGLIHEIVQVRFGSFGRRLHRADGRCRCRQRVTARPPRYERPVSGAVTAVRREAAAADGLFRRQTCGRRGRSESGRQVQA